MTETTRARRRPRSAATVALILAASTTQGCGLLVRTCTRIALDSELDQASYDGDPSTYLEGDDPGECRDGKDNDHNGVIDCAEPYCSYRPECDAATIAAEERAALSKKAQAKSGGTYALQCDRSGTTTVTLTDETCAFVRNTCPGTEEVPCTVNAGQGTFTVDLHTGDMVNPQLRMRVMSPSTLVVDANQMVFCGCGPTPRLVWKRI